MTMNVNEINGREEPWDVNAVRREVTIETASESTASNPAAMNSSTDSNSVNSKKKRSWKKPKDKPMRPLSAYNMFFQNQRERIVAGKTSDPTPEEIQASIIKMLTSKTRGPKRRQDRVSHGQISFGDLARTIAAKWKAIDPKLKAVYNHYAAQEKVRYKKEVVIWKEKKEREHDAAQAGKQGSFLTSSSTFNDSLGSVSSSVTSLSTSMASYNLSESINSLRCDPHMQMNDDVIQRQQDILRQQMGFIDSKPQARVNGGGNDVPREIPRSNLSADNIGSREFFPRPIAGNGNAGGMGMMGYNNSNEMSTSDNSNRSGSFLDSNLQQQQQNQLQQQQQQNLNKEHLLLQLQQKQLQQLQQLQKARNETGRLSNIKTTDAVSTFINSVQASKMNGNSNQDYPPPSLTSQQRSNSNQMHRNQFNDAPNNSKQILQDQFKELEGITQELNRLKQQERQMQEKIQEKMQRTNGNMWQGNDNGYGNSYNATPSVTRSSNYDSSEFNMSLNDTVHAGNSSIRSTFDDDRQRNPVRRSRSGDTSIYRGQSTGSSVRRDRSQQHQPRRHSMFGSDTGGNNGEVFAPAPASYTYGMRNDGVMGQQYSNADMSQGFQHQRQNNPDNRRDSLGALLALDETNQRQHQQQQQQQQTQNLANMLQHGTNHDIGSIFNMNMDLQD